MPAATDDPAVPDRGPVPWRRALVAVGAMLGLFAGFNGLYYATLPFFLLPIANEFGWGRADVSAAAVFSMLGVTLASPFVGRLFDRFGTERIIAASVVLLAASMGALGHLPPSRLAFVALSFVVGAAGAATTMAGYLSVLPRWFDRRLGVALGIAGVGLGLGVLLNGQLGTALIQRFGWRDAYLGLALASVLGGAVALMLLTPRGAGAAAPAGTRCVAAGRVEAAGAGDGMTLREAARTWRFWVLVATTFFVPLAILGTAVHGPALYSDRGMTPPQAAMGAGLAGIAAMLARLATGALLDRFPAPRIAAVVLLLGAAGLLIGSTASTLPMLVGGSFLCGVAIGAEGDLVPYIVRRYFGLKAFSAIFGSVFAAYTLGGVLGPMLYGMAFDHFASYRGVMQFAAALCLLSLVLLLSLGPYRYSFADPRQPP